MCLGATGHGYVCFNAKKRVGVASACEIVSWAHDSSVLSHLFLSQQEMLVYIPVCQHSHIKERIQKRCELPLPSTDAVFGVKWSSTSLTPFTECVLVSNNLALTLVPGSSLLIVHAAYMLINSVSLPEVEKYFLLQRGGWEGRKALLAG